MSAARAARRRLGQHFLADRRAVARILRSLEIRADEAVLEIGPGRGALTAELVRAAGRIAAVEVDRGLAASLRRRFPEPTLLLLERDVLAVDLQEVGAALGGGPLLVVGNLPYSISKPIAMKLVRERASVARAVLMFQREVAARLTAVPGSRAYGPLTVLCGEAYRIEALFDLRPTAFRPPPRVASSVTRWRRRSGGALEGGLEASLRACLAAAFARRRQTLRNNLRAALGSASEAETLLRAASLDGDSRAEAVPPEGFVRLARLWRERI